MLPQAYRTHRLLAYQAPAPRANRATAASPARAMLIDSGRITGRRHSPGSQHHPRSHAWSGRAMRQ